MSENLPSHSSNFLLYTGGDGKVKVEVFIQDETVWLAQKAIGQLFGVESHTITYHLKEIFKTGELVEAATARKIRAVQRQAIDTFTAPILRQAANVLKVPLLPVAEAFSAAQI